MADEHHENVFFRAWAEAVVRFRWPVLALIAVISAVAASQLVTLRFDSSTEYFSQGDGGAEALLEQYRADFGRDDLYLVVVEGDVFTEPFLDRLAGLHDALERLDVPLSDAIEVAAPADDFGFDDFGDEGWGDEAGGTLVEDVTSLIDVRETAAEDGAIRVRGLLDDMPAPEALPALKARVLAEPALVGHVVGAEGHHAVLTVRTRLLTESDSGAVSDAIEAIAAEHAAEGFQTSVTGMPTLNASLNRTVQSDAGMLVALATLVMGGVLLWLFRHPVGVIAPLMVVALASMWTLGAMAATGTPITLLTNIIPVFLACVGLGDSVHVQSVYRDLRRAGVDNREAVIRAIASTGVPVLFTSITTMAGLLSFRFTSTNAIQEMGLFGALGVGFACLQSVVFLPIALSFNRGQLGGGVTTASDRVDRFLAACTGLSAAVGRRRVVLVAGALIGAVAIGGMAQLGVYHNPLVWFGEASPITQNIRRMDHNVGGTASVHLLVDTDAPGGMKDLELLQALERLDEHIRAYRDPRTGEAIVTGTISLLDVVRETNRALHDGDPAHYRLPDDQRALSDTLLLFENAGPAELQKLVTADLSRSHLTIRLHWMDATFYGPFAEHLEAGVATHIGDRALVRPTGTAYSLLRVVGGLIHDLLSSFGVAVVIITAMMMLLLRSARLGLLSMLPNLLPVAITLGFMGWTGIAIDLSNLLLASIIIGIAVDDTIHYLHHWQVGYRETGDVEAAIRHAVVHTGRAMVSTSLILLIGFSVYLASSLVSIQRFGVLIGVTVIVALLADLVFAPALLRAVYGRAGNRTEPKGAHHVEAA